MARILVIDDYPDLTSAVKLLLQSAGHEVETALNGWEGLCLIRDRPRFDLMILDQRMPGIPGTAVLDGLPPDPPPVILMTGDPESLPGKLPPPVRHVLLKASDPAKIMAAVNDVLDARAVADSVAAPGKGGLP